MGKSQLWDLPATGQFPVAPHAPRGLLATGGETKMAGAPLSQGRSLGGWVSMSRGTKGVVQERRGARPGEMLVLQRPACVALHACRACFMKGGVLGEPV